MRVKVRNLREFQHYKNRRPPWVRLHRSVIEKEDMVELSGDLWRLFFEMVLLVTAERDEIVDTDEVNLSWALRREVDLDDVRALIDRGLLEEVDKPAPRASKPHPENPDASALLSTCKQHSATCLPERKKERGEGSDPADPCPRKEIKKIIEGKPEKKGESEGEEECPITRVAAKVLADRLIDSYVKSVSAVCQGLFSQNGHPAPERTYRMLTTALAAGKVPPDGISNATSNYIREIRDNPPSEKRYIIKPYNFFGREARWKEWVDQTPGESLGTGAAKRQLPQSADWQRINATERLPVHDPDLDDNEPNDADEYRAWLKDRTKKEWREQSTEKRRATVERYLMEYRRKGLSMSVKVAKEMAVKTAVMELAKGQPSIAEWRKMQHG